MEEKPKASNKTLLNEPFSWEAPEGRYVPKTQIWYISFFVVVASLVALALLVFKSVTFAILVPIMAGAILLLSSKRPKDINYSISTKGVYIGDRLYDFSEFKAFGLVEESELFYVILLPVKRFDTGLALYFYEKDGEKIVDMLGARLPMEKIELDLLEKIIRFIGL